MVKCMTLNQAVLFMIPGPLNEPFSPLQALKAEEYDANQASIRIGVNYVNWCLVEHSRGHRNANWERSQN